LDVSDGCVTKGGSMSEPENKYQSVDERWDYLISSMILGDPFIHEFILIMSKTAEESVKTMGVMVKNAVIRLFYSCTFLAKLTDSEARWVLVHEVLHLVFHHCTVRASTDKRMHEIDNIAADLAINQLIPNTGHIMCPREEVIRPYFPKNLGFPEKLSKEQYFQLLLDKDKEDQEKDKSNPGDDKDDSQGNGGGGDKEDPQDPGKDKSTGGGDEEEDRPFKEQGDLVDSHEGWTDEEAEIIDQMIRSKVEELNKHDRCWGKVTGGLKEQILAAQKSQIAWWRLLREYLGLMVSTRKESTMKRPNRRFGYPYPGTKRKHVDKILCATDSSGSISEDSLRRFLTEMNAIAESHPTDHVVFDDGITQGPTPFTRRRKTFEFTGRGGTNFQPVMDLAVKGKYKSLVILTDGCAAPTEYPKGVKDVIWCLVDGGEPPKGVEWGKRVYIKEKPGFQKAA
jgi:predicted metal-dependent peptidase